MENHRVRALLMGGQACVFYGAAEFSRGSDFVLHADPANLARLASAMEALRAEVIAAPPFGEQYLHRGHAIHFRCHHPEATGIRVDVMSVLRGVAPFPELWQRRTTIESPSGTRYELLSLPDLVRAKKTQRDKDWPMVRRLIEAHHARHAGEATPARIDFWLREARTPALLATLARDHPAEAAALAPTRPLLVAALAADPAALESGLVTEEAGERAADRKWWAPLRQELESLRADRLRAPPPGAASAAGA